jgi:hypothetical protein
LTTLSALAMLDYSHLDRKDFVGQEKTDDHAPDRRMIANFVSSILEIIPRMENRTHDDLATARDTLHTLCRGPGRGDTSISARDFEEALADAAANAPGTHRHQLIWLNISLTSWPHPSRSTFVHVQRPLARLLSVIPLTTNVLVDTFDTQFNEEMLLKDRVSFHIVLPWYEKGV